MEISGVLVLAVKGALGSSEHQTAGVGMSKMLSLLASPWLEAKRFSWGCQASRFMHALHVACLGPRQGSRTSYKRLAVPWGLIPRDQSRRLKASYDFANHTMLLYFHPHSVPGYTGTNRIQCGEVWTPGVWFEKGLLYRGSYYISVLESLIFSLYVFPWLLILIILLETQRKPPYYLDFYGTINEFKVLAWVKSHKDCEVLGNKTNCIHI